MTSRTIILSCFFSILLVPLCSFAQGLPLGYRSIRLGMSLEQAQEALKNDSLFGYRGERDVSLLPGKDRTLIETAGDTWLKRCWFQFYENKLYIIIINFNPEKLDYYSVFNSLYEKYGEPMSLSPDRVLWQNDKLMLTLERPVSVKYTDRAIFDKLLDQKRVDEAGIEIIRSAVLDAL